MRHADSVTLYAHPDHVASALVLSAGDARLTLMLSSEVWRGFSGEGVDLLAAGQGAEESLAPARAALRWRARVPEDELGGDALAALASLGLVGFDHVDHHWYHREFPFRPERVTQLQPRLRSAQRLLDAGAVHLAGSRARVRSGGHTHQLDLSSEPPTCTCRWFASTQGARGPCKHVLAAQLLQEDADVPPG